MHPIRLVVVVDPMILILTFKDDAVDENMAKNAIIKVKPSLQTRWRIKNDYSSFSSEMNCGGFLR